MEGALYGKNHHISAPPIHKLLDLQQLNIPHSALALPRSLVPSDVAMSALAQCKADASRGVNASATKCDSCSHRQHGTINHKNGAKAGHAAVTLSYRSVHAVDPELSRQLVALAQELGYDLDGDGEG